MTRTLRWPGIIEIVSTWIDGTCDNSIMSHSHPATEMIQAVREQCKQLGVRLTPLREAVLQLVLESGKPIKAYDLLDRLREDHAGAAPPTVYRALDFLLQHGFIHRLASMNAYVGCGHPDAPHDSQFLICDSCDTTVELEDSAIAGRLQTAARSQGFTTSHQTIEVHGLCEECSDEGSDSQP
jgi:Fur family zinc uptake transcriptional regulator